MMILRDASTTDVQLQLVVNPILDSSAPVADLTIDFDVGEINPIFH